MNESKSNAGTWVVGIITVLLLGYIAYQVSIDGAATPEVPTSQQNEATTTEPEVSLAANITAQEAEVINPPADLSSTSSVEEYHSQLRDLAVTTNMIEVENCQADNKVVHIQNGQELNVLNAGTEELTLNLNQQNYTVAPDQSLTWVAGSGTQLGAGYFGLICMMTGQPSDTDPEPTKVSLIWVTQSATQ